MMLILAVAVLVGSAYGQDAVDPELQGFFNTMDIDKDGFVDLTEYLYTFTYYDMNGNGKVSRHEYTETICRADPNLYDLAHYLFDHFDYDHDHDLQRDDFTVVFHKTDTGGDGKFDVHEYQVFSEQAYRDFQLYGQHHETHNHGHSHCH